MRAKLDPLFAEILHRARWGALTPRDCEILNTRVIAAAVLDAPRDPYTHTPVIVTTNQLRRTINVFCTWSVAKSLGKTLFESRAIPSARARDIFDGVRHTDDALTDNIPMTLHWFIGMPIMVTKTHPDLKSLNVVANGTMGTIIGAYGGIKEQEVETEDGVIFCRYHVPPKMLLVKVTHCNTNLVMGFPPGVLGIPLMTASVKLDKIPNLSASSLTVQQFPLVPCFACTTDKMQGQTCPNGIVVTRLHRQGMPPQTLYVALSRTTMLSKLTLTSPITAADTQRGSVPNDVRLEMERLHSLVVLHPDAPPHIRGAFEAQDTFTL